MANKDDLLARATAASLRVTELTSELKKVRAEAVALRRQVLDALGRKPRQRKSKATGTHCAHGLPYTTSCQKCGREIAHHPTCWFDGCGKPSVADVNDIEGRTWECCADHMVAHQTPDAEESNAESEYRRIKEQHKARPENTND